MTIMVIEYTGIYEDPLEKAKKTHEKIVHLQRSRNLLEAIIEQQEYRLYGKQDKPNRIL